MVGDWTKEASEAGSRPSSAALVRAVPNCPCDTGIHTDITGAIQHRPGSYTEVPLHGLWLRLGLGTSPLTKRKKKRVINGGKCFRK